MPNTQGPFGLRPVAYINGAAWNNQLDQSFTIASGYANNIFIGDPVIVRPTANGATIVSLYDANLGGYPTGGVAGTYANTPILGIFQGCYYQTTSAVNPIDPAGPKTYWPAGTTTLSGQPAIASLVVDPNVVYEIQADGSAATSAANRMNYAAVTIPNTAGIVTGNPTLATSTVALAASTLAATPGAPALNLRLWQYAPGYNNTDASLYNIWRVIIENNYLNARNVS